MPIFSESHALPESTPRKKTSEWNDAQRAEITEELDRILADSRFNTSQRCVALLQHLVEHALNGDRERIKERTLGIEVFGRDPGYDVNADPVVRRTASEIRKRLAQCYQDSDRQQSVTIRLIAGSYLPQFDFGCQEPVQDFDSEELLEPVEILEPESAQPVFQTKVLSVFQNRWLLGSATAVLLMIGVGFYVIHADFWRSTNYLVWKPFLDSSQGLFLCLPDDRPIPDPNARSGGGPEGGPGRNAAEAHGGARGDANAMPKVLFTDATISYRIYSRLAAYGGTVALRTSSMVMLHQFRRRPIVLIGGFNNPWSMMLLSKLRYSLREDPATGAKWIQDSQNSANREWEMSGSPEQSEIDYALITRFWDAETGGWVMVLSGLGPFGTESAALLLTDPSMESLLPANLRSAKNYQIVLKASVVHESSGSPQILAIYTW